MEPVDVSGVLRNRGVGVGRAGATGVVDDGMEPVLLIRCPIVHLSGEVEMGASDGAKRELRAGDIRLMEDITGKGHSHNILTPKAAVYVLLND